ncbi:ATP-grasp domain-containing protein [Kitasatospora sp. NBC_00315]|uniref:ATP-grasp domain-containing protein n=1 Tax=Kitasatospora sp. NBC_00315 TaxID=2975963 RepID=UPI00324A9071
MNPARTLLLVGGNEDNVRKAKAHGLDVILLQHPEKFTPEQRELADVTVLVDYTDWTRLRPVAEDVHTDRGFAVALSLTEAGVEGAARINDLLGLGGTGLEVTRRLRDKWTMRRRLAELDPAALGARLLEDRSDLDRFGAAYGYPFIVKPTDATASFGVHRVADAADADRVWAEAERMRGGTTDRGTTLFAIRAFLMEEYIDGPEFSVESFSFAGRHVVIAITEKSVDEQHFAELGHALPARLSERVQEQVADAVAGFLDAVGLRDGVTHTELRIGARGPAVIESHNRPGGDGIMDLVEAAYGIDLTSLAIGWSFGLVEPLPGRPAALRGAATRFLTRTAAGRVDAVEGEAEVAAHPDVLSVRIAVRPGDAVRPLKDNWDRLGQVSVTGSTTSAAVELCEQLIATGIRIQVSEPAGALA